MEILRRRKTTSPPLLMLLSVLHICVAVTTNLVATTYQGCQFKASLRRSSHFTVRRRLPTSSKLICWFVVALCKASISRDHPRAPRVILTRFFSLMQPSLFAPKLFLRAPFLDELSAIAHIAIVQDFDLDNAVHAE